MADIRADESLPCPSCSSNDLVDFYRVQRVPVESCVLYHDRRSALAAERRSITLAFCRSCGLIFNRDHDKETKQTTSSALETQTFSPRYQAFCEALAQKLIDKYALRHRSVLEVGCGDGYFLSTICQMGQNTGIGIDPAADDTLPFDSSQDIRLIKDFFSEAHSHLDADLLVCRHTLEHLLDVRALAQLIAQHIKRRPQAVGFIEVPDAMRILEGTAFWDIYYEHCCYFTCGSLARLFRSAGLEVEEIRLGFAEQYILMDVCQPGTGRPLQPLEEEPAAIEAFIRRFALLAARARRSWRDLVSANADRDGAVVLWGSAPKCASFLAAINCGTALNHLVNINPEQQGRYVAGTGQEIVAPSDLPSLRPSLIINLNSVYDEEIREEVRRMGLGSRLISIDRQQEQPQSDVART